MCQWPHRPIFAKAKAIGDTNKRPTFFCIAAAVFSSNIQECKTVIVKEPQSDRKSRRESSRALSSSFSSLKHTDPKWDFLSENSIIRTIFGVKIQIQA